MGKITAAVLIDRQLRVEKLEKLEKFARKVARIPLIDIEIALQCPGRDSPCPGFSNSRMKEKLVEMVCEAKILTGKVKKKHTTMDSSP